MRVIPAISIVPAGLARAYAVAIGLVALWTAAVLAAEPALLARESWQSEVLAPCRLALFGDAADLADAGPSVQFIGGECCGDGGDGLDILFFGRTAGSYYNVPGETRGGAAYGLDAAMHLTGDWGFVGCLNANSIADGTQLVGSLGVVKLADPCGCLPSERISFSAFFDQFTDNRVDTFSGSLYTSQFRLQAGYVTDSGLEVGGVYSEPLQEDDDVMFRLVNFPASLPIPGRLDMSRILAAYVAGQSGEWQWSLLAGYREPPGTMLVAGTLRRPLGEQVALYGGLSYEEDRGNWGAGFGLEFNFGPSAGCGCGSSCGGSCCEVAMLAPRGGPNAIADLKSPPIQLVNLPRGPFGQPPENLGSFPLGLGLGDGGGDATSAGPRQLWTQRYLNWNARLVTHLPAYEVSRGLNLNGLTDLTQDAIQSPFSPFAVQVNGEIGATHGRRAD